MASGPDETCEHLVRFDNSLLDRPVQDPEGYASLEERPSGRARAGPWPGNGTVSWLLFLRWCPLVGDLVCFQKFQWQSPPTRRRETDTTHRKFPACARRL